MTYSAFADKAASFARDCDARREQVARLALDLGYKDLAQLTTEGSGAYGTERAPITLAANNGAGPHLARWWVQYPRFPDDLRMPASDAMTITFVVEPIAHDLAKALSVATPVRDAPLSDFVGTDIWDTLEVPADPSRRWIR